MSKIMVTMDTDDVIDLLCDRVDYWRSDSPAEADLSKIMYENYVENCCFDGMELDVKQIVDNDIVNNCDVIEKGDPDFEKLLELYKKGEYDVSCEEFENCGASYIEAVNYDEDMILIRY